MNYVSLKINVFLPAIEYHFIASNMKMRIWKFTGYLVKESLQEKQILFFDRVDRTEFVGNQDPVIIITFSQQPRRSLAPGLRVT